MFSFRPNPSSHSLSRALRRVEERLSRAGDPTLYSRAEFGTKRHAGPHVLATGLDGAKPGILGEAHALAAATSQSRGQAHAASRGALQDGSDDEASTGTADPKARRGPWAHAL